MTIDITQPHAANAIVKVKIQIECFSVRFNSFFSAFIQITLGRVLKAVLIFKGVMIEWVTVKGYDETFNEDLWAESRYQVFRRVQDHTHAAMLHFYSPTLPDLAVKFFMVST